MPQNNNNNKHRNDQIHSVGVVLSPEMMSLPREWLKGHYRRPTWWNVKPENLKNYY